MWTSCPSTGSISAAAWPSPGGAVGGPGYASEVLVATGTGTTQMELVTKGVADDAVEHNSPVYAEIYTTRIERQAQQ